MAGYICIGGLAAFGLLSMLWCLFGWLLPSGKNGVLICIGDPVFLHRFLWLRSLGLLRCPLRVPEGDFSQKQRDELSERGVEICSRERLLSEIGIGAEEI
jgi:hypothetical protein